ncbi:MAG: hypothetical protein K2N63_11395 [Lachnospiraceae bacterium]|nr:hypothetical protein [Lachnospiraceae bacterium]
MRAGKLPGVVEERSLLMYMETTDKKVGMRRMEPAQVALSERNDGYQCMLATDQMGIFGNDQTKAFCVGALFDRVCGKLAASGAAGEVFTISLSLPPKCEEKELKKLAQVIARAAKERDITAYSLQAQGRYESGEEGVVQMTVTGAGKTPLRPVQEALQPAGKTVIMAGYAALEATAVFLLEQREFLLRRLAAGYLAQGLKKAVDTDVREAARIAFHAGALVKTAGEGGVYAALWELGEYLDCGMDLNPYDILLHQETIEVCELLDISPYMLASGGCLFAVTGDAEALLAAYRTAGIAATKIGTLKEGRDRVLHNGEEERFLEPFRAEEMYRVLEGRMRN